MSSPINLDLYEIVILYNCLKKGNEEYLASCIDHLTPELFNSPSAGSVIEIVKNFYVEHNTIPNLTEVKTKIVDYNKQEAYKDLVSQFSKIDMGDYTPLELVKNTEQFIKQRMLKEAIEKSVEEFAVDKVLDDARILRDLDKISSISLIDNLGMDFFEDTTEFLDKLKSEDSFISTGFPDLDREFGGGLYAEGKAIYGIAGATNVGKSIVLGNIGANVLNQGKNVAIISLEMSEFRYARRMASILSNICTSDLVENEKEFLEYVVKFKNDVSSHLFIKEFPTKQVSAKHVAGYLKKLERQKGFKPDVIILDYHTLLKPSIPQPSIHASMQFVTQEARALSYVFEAPVLTAAQLNRDDGNMSSPGLGRIAGSWDMLSDLDYLVNIWQTDEDREADIIRWAIKKARDSERNVEHFFNIAYETLRLSNGGSMDDSIIQSHKDDLADLLGGSLF